MGHSACSLGETLLFSHRFGSYEAAVAVEGTYWRRMASMVGYCIGADILEDMAEIPGYTAPFALFTGTQLFWRRERTQRDGSLELDARPSLLYTSWRLCYLLPPLCIPTVSMADRSHT